MNKYNHVHIYTYTHTYIYTYIYIYVYTQLLDFVFNQFLAYTVCKLCQSCAGLIAFQLRPVD